jgi:hypothetical protein
MEPWHLVVLLSLLLVATLPAQKPRRTPGKRGPDPAAIAVRFQIVARTGPWTGRVRITGVIRNVGDTTSRFGNVWLWEGSRVVAQRSFTSQAPGQSLTVSYQRSWDASSPSEGEFPPTYEVTIPYAYEDPNYLDDRFVGNNSRRRSGAGMNALFRAPPNVLAPGSRRDRVR